MNRVSWILLLIPVLAAAQVKLTVNAIDSSAGNVECYMIETDDAIWYLEKDGAGLSSLVDRDGNDWLGFHPEPGTGSAGEYRGFPNAIHQQDGSFFHPMNTGTDSSVTQVVLNSPDRVSIKAVSGNDHWQALWDFYPTHCTFTMVRMPAGYKYWVLYEGTPGGQYDDSDWYLTSSIHKKTPLTINHDGDIPAPEWIAFGDMSLPRVLFLSHEEDDVYPDRFYQMESNMTVFGFGRNGLEKYLHFVPQRFSIGFINSIDPVSISEKIKEYLKQE